MHIPMQVDYGVRALVDLSIHGRDGSVRANEIAKRQGIPGPYLERVMYMLQKGGLTESRRGPSGGHALALSPSDITIGAVMENLGGNQPVIGCLDNLNECDQSPSCGQRSVWREVDKAVQKVLDGTTIADLIKRTK